MYRNAFSIRLFAVVVPAVEVTKYVYIRIGARAEAYKQGNK